MKTSESIQKISGALLKAQLEFKTASKNKVNPYFKSKYATYTEVLSCVKEPLNKNGITILQPIDEDVVETILLHESGEYISSSTRIYNISNKPQDYGSAITYARRYALSAILAIDSDEDDDGNAANGNHNNLTLNPQQQKPKGLDQLRFKVASLLKAGASAQDIEEYLGYPLTEVANHLEESIKKINEFENIFYQPKEQDIKE